MQPTLSAGIVSLLRNDGPKTIVRFSDDPFERLQQAEDILDICIDDPAAQAKYDIGDIRKVRNEARAYITARAQDATYDQLTGLFNLRGYEEHAPALMDVTRRLEGHLLYVLADVDHFKQVNDAYGHPIGDRVLAALGEASRETLRGGDLGCRVGGDEFVFLLPAATQPGKEAIARLDDRYRRILDEERLPHTDISYGHATYDEDVRRIPDHRRMPAAALLETLKSIADSRMYRSKRAA